MRIGLVITELDPGGAEINLVRLATGLRRRGDSVAVFSLAGPPTDDDRLLNRLRSAGIDVELGDPRRRRLPLVVSRMRAWLRRRRPELVQSFLFHADVVGLPVAAIGCRTAVRVSGVRVAQPDRRRLRLHRNVLRLAHHVVSVSEGVDRFVGARLGVEPGRRTVIGNAVDVARFDDATPFDWRDLGWPAGSRVVVFVGRLDPQKNVAAMLRNADAVLDRDRQRRLLIVGDGPLAGDVDRWVRSRRDDRVRWFRRRTDIPSLLKAAATLWLPSRYEGMANVMLEAMAAGIPVACGDVEGVEVLGRHRSEQTFAPDDDAGMIGVVDRWLSGGETAHDIGRDNRNAVAAAHGIDAMVDAYRELYRRLIDARAGR